MKRAGYDCAVVGAGIVGLAHAWVAARAGLSTVVLERSAAAVGASIRNFGFVTVTGQQAGATWRRARRSRDVWASIAIEAGIAVAHRGLVLAVRRPEAIAVLEEFAAGPMGEGCRLLTPAELARQGVYARGLLGALASPHELRVDSRDAIPRLARRLRDVHGVEFRYETAVNSVTTGRLETARGVVAAGRIVVCPGPDLATLFPDPFRRRRVTLCKLQMLRLAPPGWRLPATVMSDLGLVRYAGYADLPSRPALAARLQAEQPEELAHGVHLIVVQQGDGSLIVGDSHHEDDAHDPFQSDAVDQLILAECRRVLDVDPQVVERWVGFYPVGGEPAFIAAPLPGVRLVSVTSGTGASTAFALAEETFAGW